MAVIAKISKNVELVAYEGTETDTAKVIVEGKSLGVDVKKAPGTLKIAHQGEVVSYDGSSDATFSIDDELAKGTDLAKEISDRETADVALDSKLTNLLSQEKQSRIEGDSELKTALDKEIADRKYYYESFSDEISAEASDRKAQDDSLGKRISSVETGLAAESKSRQSKDDGISADLAKEVADRKAAEETIKESVSSEVANRQAADAILQTSLSEESNRAKEEESSLSGRVSSFESSLNIDGNVAKAKWEETGEDDSAILATHRYIESYIKPQWESVNEQSISRDNDLQTKIDAIKESHNFVAAVASESDLASMDTTNLDTYDCVLVMRDSTREEQSAVYRYNGNDSDSFDFVGELGSYYTKAQIDSQHNEIEETASLTYAKISESTKYLRDGSGKSAVSQEQDGTSGTFDFTGKNPNATSIDSSLTGQITYGGVGAYSAVFGGKASAQGKRSFAQGTTTIAKGAYSHAEGDNSVALGNDSHAEGYATTAYGLQSHSEGFNTVATGTASHSEGKDTKAAGEFSHAEGKGGTANGNYSHIEGVDGKSLTSIPSSGGGSSSDNPGGGDSSGGTPSITDLHYGETTHVEGESCIAIGYGSHVGGYSSQTNGQYSFAHGDRNYISGYASAGFGKGNTEEISSNVNYNFLVGNGNKISGTSIALNNFISGSANKIENTGTTSTSNNIISGAGNSVSNVSDVLVMGSGNGASDKLYGTADSIIVGSLNSAQCNGSLLVGQTNTNKGNFSAVIGNVNYLGTGCNNSMLLGQGLLADNQIGNQIIVGKFNARPSSSNAPLFTVGNGTGESDRKNAFTVTSDGRAKVSGAPTEDDDVVRKSDLPHLYRYDLYCYSYKQKDADYACGFTVTGYSTKELTLPDNPTQTEFVNIFTELFGECTSEYVGRTTPIVGKFASRGGYCTLLDNAVSVDAVGIGAGNIYFQYRISATDFLSNMIQPLGLWSDDTKDGYTFGLSGMDCVRIF